MLFFVTVTVLLASVNANFYTDCGSKAKVQSVDVTGCAADAKECVLKRNTNATFSIDFTPNKVAPAVHIIVHGVVMNLPIPFPIPQPDACKEAGLTCPLQPGQPVKFTTSMPVLKSYPKVKVDVKWELRDDNEEDLVCVLISARIQ
ncbi:ecdysteroid-regulated 16 kDa protein-like [Trichoplusia ni]|uniref:Ecdysteroid-regulated 16 kDa protein-like n=1 Tax=Trichoplusia ni TaxID=7111 RepID=A0A7E5WMM5_TRINI|nr:ecdysteroid-regulated 16 kDa protein-like [Trichoplusia ni]